MKVCTKCLEKKTLQDFSRKRVSKDGYETQCRSCINTHVREDWYPKNRDKRVEGCRKYKQNNKTKLLASRHNLPLSEVEEALKDSDGLCEICRKDTKLFLDHCHDSLKVRGLLCQNCNSALGFLGDSREVVLDLLSNIREYLDK